MNGQLTIAIVDDDESIRMALHLLLKQRGFAIESFASAEQFLASNLIPGCLLLDIALPGMSGPELSREFARSGHALPIIFVTGQQDEHLRRELLAAGAHDVLFKPVRESELLGIVENLLTKRDVTSSG